MTKSNCKVTLHMVSSLDGFIAKKDGNSSWMESTDNYSKGVTLTAEAINDFLKAIDCYVMGARTYEHALQLGWPYGDKHVIVLSHSRIESDRPNVESYSGDLQELMQKRLYPNYQNIWVVGGAAVTKAFIQARLADELVISIMPILLGDGLKFFDHIEVETHLHLKEVIAYKDGMVEMCYEILKESNQRNSS